MLSLNTLHMLRQCLVSQQLNVGDPGFLEIARQAATALTEVDKALTELEASETP